MSLVGDWTASAAPVKASRQMAARKRGRRIRILCTDDFLSDVLRGNSYEARAAVKGVMKAGANGRSARDGVRRLLTADGVN